MVVTLYRYIFHELTKIFLLTTLALSAILCLGCVIQPIQQYGLGPKQVLGLLLGLLPVTLTFVLPLAALFACTLTFGRLAGDNELDACRASGISPATIVYPGMVLAIMVAIANLMLSFYVMPYFIHHAETSFKANAKQILFRNIQRRGSWRSPDFRISVYADYVDLDNDTLFGVIVCKTLIEKIEAVYYAEKAKVFVESEKPGNTIRLVAHNTLKMGKATSVRIKTLDVEVPFASLLEDQVKYKYIDDLKKIQADPLLFYPNEKRARKMCTIFTAELLFQRIKQALDTKGAYYIFPVADAPNSVSIKADNVQLGRNRDITFGDRVEVQIFDVRTSIPHQRLICKEARLTLVGNEFSPTLLLDLRSVRGENSLAIMTYRVEQNLALPQDIYPIIQRNRVISTLTSDVASTYFASGLPQNMSVYLEILQTHIRRVNAKIIGTIHARLAFAIGCIPMIVIGIGIGILKRNCHLLTAFGISCVPALILIVGIICGKQVAEHPQSSPTLGLVIMWAGVAALGAITLGGYVRFNKHL